MSKKMVLVLSFAVAACGLPLESTSSLGSFGFADSCTKQATSAVLAGNPEMIFTETNIRYQIEFDCREASFITSLDSPVKTSRSALAIIQEATGLDLNLPFFRSSMDILKPYCRSDNDDYGGFCMATDVDAAKMVFARSSMLENLPKVIYSVARWIETHEKSNLVYAVLDVYPGSSLEAVLMAGFLGLDDNGVQVDRLRANLLWAKRFDDYARIFKSTAQYAALGSMEGTKDLPMILFATRMGYATVPGLAADVTKTYKAYAGLYFGCRLAMENEFEFLVVPEAYAIGVAYEILKTKDLVDRSLAEISREIPKYAAASDETGRKLSAGAAYGFKLCSD